MNPFFHCIPNEGYFALIVASPDKTLFGEKSFFSAFHPLVENPSLGDFWSDFWDRFDFQQVLPATVENTGGTQIFVHKLSQKPELVILGGGHVGYCVYQLGVFLGFSVMIVDDRKEFCNASRFPQAAALFACPFAEALPKLSFGQNSYAVIVTRGHQEDSFCLSQILTKGAAYIGMIGSRRKVGLLRDSLAREGFLPEQIDSVFTPIGLSIGAQTPEEIAVSIFAQIIQQKNLHGAASYSDDAALQALSQPFSEKTGPKVFCMIIHKSGSIPRAAGSKMTVDAFGKSVGSIGGGKIEYELSQEAIKLCSSKEAGPLIRSFHMDAASAQSEGMVCGGSAEIYMERID